MPCDAALSPGQVNADQPSRLALMDDLAIYLESLATCYVCLLVADMSAHQEVPSCAIFSLSNCTV